jgi:aminoglycoside phosphotransferase (APT) family kinase protein
MAWQKPQTEDVRAALRIAAPHLAEGPIDDFAEGWEVWAYEVAGYVLRLPKNEASVQSLRLERVLLPELAIHLSVPVPRIDVWGEDGPNGAPFAGHLKLPGTPVWPTGGKASQANIGATPTPSSGFGRDFGRLLRKLREVPVERAVALGVPVRDAAWIRAKRIEGFGEVVRRVFPLLSCETRTYVEKMYLRAINDERYYETGLHFVHGDLDVNTLIDERGEITGVIDFGQAFVGGAAADYWLPLHGFEKLGIPSQTSECLVMAGIDDEELSRLRPVVDFLDFRFPLLDILYGLDNDPDYVEEGIRELNSRVPAGIVCE